MSGSSGIGGSRTQGEKTSGTSGSNIALPSWVNAGGYGTFTGAQAAAQRPVVPFDFASAFGPAQAGYSSLAGYSPDIPRDAPAADVNKWFNPFTENVVKNTIQDADIVNKQNLNTVASQAQAAKSFGGSRFAVQQGVTSSETARKADQVIADLRRQGWDSATAAALADATRTGNYQLGVGGLENQAANIRAGGLAGLTGVGNLQYSDFTRDQDLPLKNMMTLSSILQGLPTDRSETGTKSATTSSKSGATPDWATIGLGALKTLGPMIPGVGTAIGASAGTVEALRNIFGNK